ncbi:unnamed protein product [Adineta steineri]|uniref:Uncharacterized protein n=1 Tax=Adineta steineri TaxID=433720 RepID=A0A813PDB7_9BILA|nr:unnamed protein product [Adineta steineri]CAF0753288.1 unnamed protein product [Adineta steineri]CAF0833294.1 unnamed protein product [Adineta steineri]
MFLSVFFFCLLITITTSITPVPGTIHVRLLPDNQITSGNYRASSTVHYTVEFENVPINDNVLIGIEIRGSNPSGGPRGYISGARSVSTINNFIKETNNRLQFKLLPNDVFAGYSWFIRPFIYFANESMVSTNMMNSGSSEMFNVLKQ